jgi:plastocyanin
MRKAFLVCAMVILAYSACSRTATTEAERTVREIQIGDAVQPQTLYAKPGEEIRWRNTRSTSVNLGFLTTSLLKNLSCQKGLVTMFGEVKDFVSIPPQQSVSACFVRPGEVKYNVWLNPEDVRGAISPTATVRVEAGS